MFRAQVLSGRDGRRSTSDNSTMAQPTILLDLAEAVSSAALTITRSQLASVTKGQVNEKAHTNGHSSAPDQKVLEATTQLGSVLWGR